jgi:hypothetical protein
MNIYEFLDSKDIAAHCREIKHEFTALEQAVIVYHSGKIPAETHEAWQWIIDNLPDENLDIPSLSHDSLHEFLRDYITLENKLIERATSDEPGDSYSCIDWDDDKIVDDSTFSGVLVKARDCLAPNEIYTIFKRWEGWQGTAPPIDMYVKLDGEILLVKTPGKRTFRTPHIPEYELLHTFDECDMQVDIPVPFKKGNIVFEALASESNQ